MKTIFTLSLSAILINPAAAAITVTFSDNPGNVTINIQGSADVSGLTGTTTGQVLIFDGIQADTNGLLVAEAGVNMMISTGADLSAIADLGLSRTFRDFDVEPEAVGIVVESDGSVGLSPTFISETPVANDFVFVVDGESFASLGIIPNSSSVATWENDGVLESITFATGSAIPEPTTGLLALLAGFGFLANRRRS